MQMGRNNQDPRFEDLLTRCLECQVNQQPLSEQLEAEIKSTPLTWGHVMRSRQVLGESSHAEAIWNAFGYQGVSLSPVG